MSDTYGRPDLRVEEGNDTLMRLQTVRGVLRKNADQFSAKKTFLD
jgi:hypothetical protein